MAGFFGYAGYRRSRLEFGLRIRAAAFGSPPHRLPGALGDTRGLAGAAAFDHSVFRANVGYVYDQAAPIGDVILGAPYSQALEVTFHGRAAHSGMYPEEGRSAIAAHPPQSPADRPDLWMQECQLRQTLSSRGGGKRSTALTSLSTDC